MGNECVLIVHTPEKESEVILTLSSLHEHNPNFDVVVATSEGLSANMQLFMDTCNIDKVHVIGFRTETDSETEILATAIQFFCEQQFKRAVFIEAGAVVTGPLDETITTDFKDCVFSATHLFHMTQNDKDFESKYRRYNIDNYNTRKDVNRDYFSSGCVVIEIAAFSVVMSNAFTLQNWYLEHMKGAPIEEFLNVLLRYMKMLPMPKTYNHLTDINFASFLSYRSALHNSLSAQERSLLNMTGESSPMRNEFRLNVRTMRLPMDIYIEKFNKVRLYMPDDVCQRVDSFTDKYVKLIQPLRDGLRRYYSG